MIGLEEINTVQNHAALSKERRERLDRFVAAALTGFECRLNANQFVPKEIARMLCSHAQAVLDELERQEKGGQ